MLFSIVWTFLTILEVILCVLLIGIILLQKSKSHGATAGLAFGAGMGEQLFGSRAGNILTQATVVLLTAFLINTTILAALGSRARGSRSVTDSLPPDNVPITGGGVVPQAAPLAHPSDMTPPASPDASAVPQPQSGVVGEPLPAPGGSTDSSEGSPAENLPTKE